MLTSPVVGTIAQKLKITDKISKREIQFQSQLGKRNFTCFTFKTSGIIAVFSKILSAEDQNDKALLLALRLTGTRVISIHISRIPPYKLL